MSCVTRKASVTSLSRIVPVPLRPAKEDPSKTPVWQPIIANYSPTLIGECEKAIAWSNEMVIEWLISSMLKDENDAKTKARKVVKELGDHALTKSHARTPNRHSA